MTDNRFYKWLMIALGTLGLLMLLTVQSRSATRSYKVENTAHAIPLDSGKLFWGYLGSGVVDSTAGAARGSSPQNYDTTAITLDNADSAYWLNYRLWPTGDSVIDYRLYDILPIKSAVITLTHLRTVTYWAIDTSASPDDTLAGVKITSAISGGDLSTFTLATGSTVQNLDDGTYTVKAARLGYIFSDSTLILTSDTTINRLAYSFPIVLPSDPDVARVFGRVRKSAYIMPGDSSALGLEGVEITATIYKFDQNLTDTTGTSGIMYPSTLAPAISDSLGLFELYLKRTNSFDKDSVGYWNITGIYNGIQVMFIERLFIPDTGQVDLADSLALR